MIEYAGDEYNDDEYGDHDSLSEDEITERLIKMHVEIAAVIASNSDERPKEVGDKIRLWDGSSLLDEQRVWRNIHEPAIKGKLFIVVEKGQWAGPDMFTLDGRNWANDLKIVSLEDKSLVLYTNSQFVQLEDFKTPETIINNILNTNKE